MKNSTRGIIAGGLMLTSMEATTACDVRVTDPVVYNIVDASNRNNLSDIGMLGMFTCESMLKPETVGRYDGKTYLGLGQHRDIYWPPRADDFNRRHPDSMVSRKPAGALDARSAIEVTTEMVALGGLGPWQCETDYHCYSNPTGNKKMCKPQVWQNRVARAGGVIMGKDVVFPALMVPPTTETTVPETTTIVAPAEQLARFDPHNTESVMSYAFLLEAEMATTPTA